MSTMDRAAPVSATAAPPSTGAGGLATSSATSGAALSGPVSVAPVVGGGGRRLRDTGEVTPKR
jgi:hypothetical protein